MTYQIRQEQKMVTFRTLAQVENENLTTTQILVLNNHNLPSDIYNQYNQLYNSVTYSYAQARSRATKDTNKLLSSIPTPTRNIYMHKVLVDKGNTTKLGNSKVVKDEYDNFNSIVKKAYIALNKAQKRSTQELTIQVSNTSTEHAFRDNFNSILLHNHALILTNRKVSTKELEKIISSKLPKEFTVKVKEFNEYESSEQLVITSSNRNDPKVITSLNNWITYIYKTVAQKPFKNYKELQAFENLPLEQRYNLIRVQQLITKGIRKHTSLTIHFPLKKNIRAKKINPVPIPSKPSIKINPSH